MIQATQRQIEDIPRMRWLSQALDYLNKKSYLFRSAYRLGYPKFTSVTHLRSQPMTAFVGLDKNEKIVFCWGRQFFDRLASEEGWNDGSTSLDRITFVLAHETLHVVMRHITRSAGKVANIWNIAADIVVNHYCAWWYGLYVLPGSVVADQFPEEWGIDPETQTTEQIYELLLRNADVSVSFQPGHGHHDQWEQYDQQTRDILDSKISGALEDAAREDEASGNNDPDNPDGKGCGKLPGDSPLGEVREIHDEIFADQSVPWHKLLRHRLGSLYQAHPQERWDRLPTRMQSQYGRVILPSMRMGRVKNRLKIMCSLDASGSMTEDDIYQMQCILAALPKEYEVLLTSFDTECYVIESLTEPVGGGGTDLADVNRVAVENEVDCVICLTDGYFGECDLDRPEDWIFVLNGTSRYVPSESVYYDVE